jgi:DNA (cytosine-5)-methyltransferase 1
VGGGGVSVQGRNIHASSATDWRSFRFIDVFAGIGGMRLAFERAGGVCVFSSEWDAAAQTMYHANFGEQPHGDITQITPESIPDHEVLLAGFPCQPFSILGDRKGFEDTRGTLFFDIERILRAKQPEALLLENVKMLKTHDNGRTYNVIIEHLEQLGYTTYTAILNALDFGLPQKRERTFIVGFKQPIHFAFPRPCKPAILLSELLEPEDALPRSLYASEQIVQNRREKAKIEPFYPSIWHENKGGNISILPYSCALRAQASYNYLLVNGVRRLSGREMLRLQGFPETFKIVVSYSELRKQVGNSVAVPVVQAIAAAMIDALQQAQTINSVKQGELFPSEAI